jgi:hypothetical protein
MFDQESVQPVAQASFLISHHNHINEIIECQRPTSFTWHNAF